MNSSTDVRQKLHDYIEVADDEKLQAMYVLLEADIEHSYSQEDIVELHRRRTNHQQGSSASYSVADSLDLVRKQGE